MVKKVSEIGEFGLIEQYRLMAFKSKDVIVSIGDDTAVLPLNQNFYQLVTTDLLLEGQHFTLDASFKKIGYKALACSVSDIAAMGGSPKHAVISLGIPQTCSIKLIKDLYHGLNQCAQEFGISIVGGDTVKSKKIIINVALVGEVRKTNLVLRSTAKVGDCIFVTGKLGGSLKSNRHYTFTPRIKESQYITKQFNPTAMIDVSDGFAADLNHILIQSKVGAIIKKISIPKHRSTSLNQALYDGEDFELIFTLNPQEARKLNLRKTNMKFHQVGVIADKKLGFNLEMENHQLSTISAKGFKHF